jgi:uncharacterized protein YbjT (DUF2867 family)
MSAKPTVLIIGITGGLGNKIASAILDKGAMNVKALVRAGSQNKIVPLSDRGVTIAEGDLSNRDSLLKACEGVDIVVSAVRGGRSETDEKEIVLLGQQKLIEAAKAQGVKRFVPSDYAYDYFKLNPGDNYNLDFRRKIADILLDSGMGYTFILNSAFTEVLFSPFFKLFDFKTGTFSYWGDGETSFATTTMDDTAKYVAEAIADPEMANRPLKIAGDILTLKQLCATYEEVKGKQLEVKHLGSAEDLKNWIAKTKQNATSHYEYLAEQYLYSIAIGKGSLDKLDNDRYPHIHSTTVKAYLSQADL